MATHVRFHENSEPNTSSQRRRQFLGFDKTDLTLDEQLTDLRLGWEGSPQQRALIAFLEGTVLNTHSIEIRNAVCIGLGSMAHGNVMRESGSRREKIARPDEGKRDLRLWRINESGERSMQPIETEVQHVKLAPCPELRQTRSSEAGSFTIEATAAEKGERSGKADVADELGFENLRITDSSNNALSREEGLSRLTEDTLDQGLPPLKCADFSGNAPICRLLIFETVLECLRRISSVDQVVFYDPAFTQEDREVLEARGHTVLQHQSAPSWIAPVAENVDENTFLFAPTLKLPAAMQAICSGQPSLVMGSDILQDDLLDWAGFDVAQFENLVLMRQYRSMKALGMGDDFGLLWPADLSDAEVLEKQQVRLWRFQGIKEIMEEQKDDVEHAIPGSIGRKRLDEDISEYYRKLDLRKSSSQALEGTNQNAKEAGKQEQKECESEDWEFV